MKPDSWAISTAKEAILEENVNLVNHQNCRALNNLVFAPFKRRKVKVELVKSYHIS